MILTYTSDITMYISQSYEIICGKSSSYSRILASQE